jgi:hypothetical protein
MRIFLCHASEQNATAERLAIALRARGHTVFLDRDDLPPAGDYQSRIQRAIDGCDLFCFLIASQSIAAGRFTLSEVGFAKRRWPNPVGHILPIMVEKIPIDAVPAYLRAVSILEPQGDVVADVLPAIEQLRPRLPWRTIGVWSGAAVIVLLAAYAVFIRDDLFPPTPAKPDQPVAAPEASQPPQPSPVRIPGVPGERDGLIRTAPGHSAPVHAATITYDIKLIVGSVKVEGSITTDGHIGTLSDNNIVAYDLVLTDGAIFKEFNSPPVFGSPHIQGTSLSATASGLSFDFSSNKGSYFGWQFLGFEDALGRLSGHRSTISFNLGPCCSDPNSPKWFSQDGIVQIASVSPRQSR